jgi:hypothetical protein
MEEEDHFTQTLLPALVAALAAAAMAARLLPLQLSLSLYSHSRSLYHAQFALSRMPLFIGIHGSSSCSFVNNGGHQIFTYFVTFGCCTNNPL